MSRYCFRCSYEVTELGRHLRESDKLKFSFDIPGPRVVYLGKTYRDGRKPADWASAVCEGEADEEMIDETMASEFNQISSASTEDKFVTPNQLSPHALAFFDGILGKLSKQMNSTVSIFRWRYGLPEGPLNPGRNRHEYFSTDGESWREIPLARSLSMSFGISTEPLPSPDVIRKEVAELAASGTEEPLGRQLFREAWNQKQERPRSALVIGVAAAEVGFKKLVGGLVPEAQWLMDEVQTPSLGKMLNNFLPTLPVKRRFKGKSIRPPKELLKQLDKAVNFRNKLVHAGQPPPDNDELEAMLRAVSDFLWICDVYAGHGWAHRYISVETMKAWPSEGKNA